MKAKLFLFLIGGLLGFLVGALFRPLVEPLAIDLFRDEGDRTEGRVVGKRLQAKRLLLTVDTAEGTVLATFAKRVEEIDMLVADGDLVTLGVPRYEPFVEDPPILTVRKQELPAGGIIPAAPEPGPGAVEPEAVEPAPDPGVEEPPGGRSEA